MKSCPHRSLTYRRCKCPVWVFGTRNGKRIRKSLDTANWQEAEDKLRALDPDEVPVRTTVAEAGERLIADCKGRKLARETVGKYRLLVNEMKRFFGPMDVAGVTLDDLAKYRETWKLSPVSAKKKIERLRTFFRFCMERGWVKGNPAVLLKSPNTRFQPTLPFTDEQMEKILWACEVYPDRPKGRRAEVKAFVLLLRYTGLRIGDAISLGGEKLKDGRLLLYTGKTGAPVYIPLPENVGENLKRVAKFDGRFFWSGNGRLKSAVADWQRSLKRLFKLAGIEGHAHMFRDTFAVSLLQSGVSLETVSILLGHSSINVGAT